MKPTPRRFGHRHLPALAAGAAVAVVVFEGFLALGSMLLPDHDLNARILTGTGLPPLLLTLWLAAWLLGSAAGGAMAAAVSASRVTGCILGVLLMAPALGLGQFAGLESTWVSAVTVLPLAGAALGAELAGRIAAGAGPDPGPGAGRARPNAGGGKP